MSLITLDTDGTLECKEDLSEYARRISLNCSPTKYILDLQEQIKDGNCPNCKKKLIPYTSKKGFTYNSNPDKSVHAVFLNDAGQLVCSTNRNEFTDYKERFSQTRESTKEQPKEKVAIVKGANEWLDIEIPTLKTFIDKVKKEFPSWTTLDVRITAGMFYNNYKGDSRSDKQ